MQGTQTHDPARNLTCALSKYTSNSDYVAKIIAGCLPENYDGNTIKEVPAMLDWALKNAGSNSTKKDGAFDLLRAHFNQNNIELFRNEEDVGCVKIPNDHGGIDAMPLGSKKGKQYIRKILYQEFDIILRSNDLNDLTNTLEAIAVYDGGLHEYRLRIAGKGSKIVIDIGDEKRSGIVCSQVGWSVETDTEIIFRRREGYQALPIPIKGGNLKVLRDLLGINDDHVWFCFLGFIINVFRPKGPYCCLIVDGEQGSGKSFISTVIKKLVDPNLAEKMRFPKSDRDLMIQAKQFFLLVFDNASGIRTALSDSLCSLATGGGFATRSLHTDEDLKIFNVCRPFIINGIGGFAHNPDLLERGIHLTLPSMDIKKHKTEKELNSALEKMLPEFLGVFMDGIVEALKNYENTPTPKGIRMADAAKWIAAAEPAFDVPKNSLVDALRKSQDETMAAVAIETALAQGIIKVLRKHHDEFVGGYADLLSQLENIGANNLKDPYFPKTPSQLSKQLTRLAPALKRAGIEVKRLARTNTGARIEIRFDGSVDYSDISLGGPGY